MNDETGNPEPLTIRCLREIAQGPCKSAELAAILGLDWKIVAGTLCTLKRAGKLQVAGITKANARGGTAFIFEITEAGHRFLRRRSPI